MLQIMAVSLLVPLERPAICGYQFLNLLEVRYVTQSMPWGSCCDRAAGERLLAAFVSINAIDPAPHRSGRKREHRSIVFATITHIPSLHKIRRNARLHSAANHQHMHSRLTRALKCIAGSLQS
jgi:hypothetical protein